MVCQFPTKLVNLEITQMMTEEQFQKLKDKIDREFPLRLKLSELAGWPKINPKNYKACEEMDLSIKDLYLEILFKKPENTETALKLIQEFYK